MKHIKDFFVCAMVTTALCCFLVLVLAFSGDQRGDIDKGKSSPAKAEVTAVKTLEKDENNSNIKPLGDTTRTRIVASATDTQLDPSARFLTFDMGVTFMPGINYSIEVKSSTPFPVQTDVYFYNGEARNGMIGIIPAGLSSASFPGKSPNTMCTKIRLATTEKAHGITATLVVKKDVDAIQDLYDEISSLNGNSLPDYWKQHIDSKAEEIWARKVQLSSHSVEFFFVTDTHWKTNARNSPALLSYLTKKCHIPLVLFGGDVIETYARSKTQAYNELKIFYDAFRSFKMITTIGNHDTNGISNRDSATYLTKAEIYGLMQRESEDFCCNTPDLLSGYMDNPSQKVRFINIYKPFSSIDEDVKVWLKERITELDESWSIILFSHALFEGKDNGVPRFSAESERLLEHIASLQSKAQIICWLAGHCHFDAIDNRHGITVISTQTDNFIKSVQLGGVEMKLHSDTEQSFDCYQIDLDKKEIYITKIGAGSNRQTTWGNK